MTWQWKAQSPGLSATRTTSTISFFKSNKVSVQLEGSFLLFDLMGLKAKPWMWIGCRLGDSFCNLRICVWPCFMVISGWTFPASSPGQALRLIDQKLLPKDPQNPLLGTVPSGDQPKMSLWVWADFKSGFNNGFLGRGLSSFKLRFWYGIVVLSVLVTMVKVWTTCDLLLLSYSPLKGAVPMVIVLRKTRLKIEFNFSVYFRVL